jgi:hypothetical protein
VRRPIVLAEPFAPSVGLTQQQVAQRMLSLVNGARAETRRCGDKVFAAAAPVPRTAVQTETGHAGWHPGGFFETLETSSWRHTWRKAQEPELVPRDKVHPVFTL